MTLANTFLMGLCNEFMVWVPSLNSYWIQPAHSHHWCHCCGSLTFSVSFGIGAMTHQDIALVRSGCYSQPVIFHRAGELFLHFNWNYNLFQVDGVTDKSLHEHAVSLFFSVWSTPLLSHKGSKPRLENSQQCPTMSSCCFVPIRYILL